MLRTSNKRLHQNLWTLAHFVGSALVLLIVFASAFYVTWKVGVYSGNASDLPNNTSMVNWSSALYEGFVADFQGNILFPISAFMNIVFPISADSSTLAMMLFVIAVSLDIVLWFNIAVWVLQLLVFVPDWAFHWLERKKDGE